MPEKKVKIVKKGTFENNIEGNKSLVTKEYVDRGIPDPDCYTYQETMDILEGNGG